MLFGDLHRQSVNPSGVLEEEKLSTSEKHSTLSPFPRSSLLASFHHVILTTDEICLGDLERDELFWRFVGHEGRDHSRRRIVGPSPSRSSRDRRSRGGDFDPRSSQEALSQIFDVVIDAASRLVRTVLWNDALYLWPELRGTTGNDDVVRIYSRFRRRTRNSSRDGIEDVGRERGF